MSAANPGGPEAASTELIDRDMAAAMTKLAELIAADGGVPGSFEGDRAQLGRIDGFWNEGAPEVEIVLPLALPGARGPIEARLYKPTSSVVPVVLFMHGGGFVRGSVNHCDCVCRRPRAVLP